MLADCYDGRHSTQSATAVGDFEQAVFAVAAHRPAAAFLNGALGADPGMVAALALRGLGVVLLAKAEDFANARRALAEAEAALAARDMGTEFERTLVAALRHATAGRLKSAAAALEARLKANPNDLLTLKLANALRFMTGEASRMRAVTQQVLPAWTRDDPGYGFVLGLHAFGLEETGAFAEAEAVGLQAVTSEAADIWGIHAVSHVMEMRGRADEGARWLESSRDLWPLCNNFGFHLAWHLALFRLENADYDAVLDLYDRDIRPTETDDFRDIANAVSMLWRLKQDGVDVGQRWQGLHEIARRRRTDTSYVFASLHYLLALIGAGDLDAASDLVACLRDRAHDCRGDDQAQVAAEVGHQAAGLILEAHRRGGAVPGLCELAVRLPMIGGSHAQRDVFVRTLLKMAADAGDPCLFDRLDRIRGGLKSEDRFARLSAARLSHAAGEGHGAARAGLRARATG